MVESEISEVSSKGADDDVEDGTVITNVNGVYIRQEQSGDVDVNSRPRHLRFSPSRSTICIRTHYVDMAVQQDQKSYVKHGVKRVHVSRSGMVVSDSNCITSMDHYGRIVSSTKDAIVLYHQP
uniref:Uncharacterized protein n=1 Tax=Plectus sambesii TaxID=2011161 RepID=A0A914V4S3_9BILA